MTYTFKTFSKDRRPCLHPSHNPPMHMYIEPGTIYTHTCPGCGESVQMHGGPLMIA